MMKEKQILIPYGYKNGEVIHVSNVKSGLSCECNCLECGMPLVARKGVKKVHHFAHAVKSDCKPETVLHKMGKITFERIFKQALKCEKSLFFKWKCETCHKEHVYDVMKAFERIEVERKVEKIRPDISFYNDKDDLVGILEIVVTHKPETEVIDFCKDKRIPLFQVNLKEFEDLSKISLEESFYIFPDQVYNFCLEPTCEQCGRLLVMRKISIVEDSCWRCGSKMKIALGVYKYPNYYGLSFYPQQFTYKEGMFCSNNGVILKSHYSKTVHFSYIAPTCPKCGAFCGNHFLRDYLELVKDENVYDMGLCCVPCNRYDIQVS